MTRGMGAATPEDELAAMELMVEACQREIEGANEASGFETGD
jgi:hypothetical protein